MPKNTEAPAPTTSSSKRSLSLQEIREAAENLGVKLPPVHVASRHVRAWGFKDSTYYQWHEAPRMKKWDGMVVTLDGKLTLCFVMDVSEGGKGRLSPTTGEDFLFHHFMEQFFPARNEGEIHLLMENWRAALRGEKLVSVEEEFGIKQS